MIYYEVQELACAILGISYDDLVDEENGQTSMARITDAKPQMALMISPLRMRRILLLTFTRNWPKSILLLN